MTWTRYVAVGDSFSEGMCDAHPDLPNRYVGWADRLAAMLAARAGDEQVEFRYANLAIRGRLLADIVGPQLDAALALEPDLISIIGGGNDLMRPSADPDALAGMLEAAVVRAREAGADVLLATTTDVKDVPILNRTRGACAVYTAKIHAIAARHGATVVEQFTPAWLQDWRMWAPDRIHMTTEAHRRWALMAADALGVDLEAYGARAGDPEDPEISAYDVPLPAAPAMTRQEKLAWHGQWAREYGGPWVKRRITRTSSGDGITPKQPEWGPAPEV